MIKPTKEEKGTRSQAWVETNVTNVTNVAQLLISYFQANFSQLLLDPWRAVPRKTMIIMGKHPLILN